MATNDTKTPAQLPAADISTPAPKKVTEPKTQRIKSAPAGDAGKRSYVSQANVPRLTLAEALRVPRAIADQYGKKPTRPIDLAAAVGLTPTSGTFRVLCGAAVGYGLTDGGPNATEIGLTEVGRRIVAPLTETDDLVAMRTAAMTPSVIKKFLEQYDGSPLPAEHIAQNVLESMEVPFASTKRVFEVIVANARDVGFLKEIKGRPYVDINMKANGTPVVSAALNDEAAEAAELDLPSDDKGGTRADGTPLTVGAAMRNRKVFVSHGKVRRVASQLKELLTFGDFEPVVSVDRESVSKPVPQKVLDDMRLCAAGIIHVTPEERLIDKEGNERAVLNENVLIEIGAAMALYGQRFILLVQEGAALPSNLQGLYEVRYSGDELGYEATMKVLKAMNEFKSGGTA